MGNYDAVEQQSQISVDRVVGSRGVGIPSNVAFGHRPPNVVCDVMIDAFCSDRNHWMAAVIPLVSSASAFLWKMVERAEARSEVSCRRSKGGSA